MAEKAAEKKAAVEQNKQDKKAVHDAGPSKSAAEKKSEKKRADGLAEAFPGSQPDPGPEPRPALELSKEQKQEAEDVRALQVKALENNFVNVPGHEVVEVLAHTPGKTKDADNQVKALSFLNVGSEVVMHVESAGDLYFTREEFAQLERAVTRIGGTL